MLLPQTLKAFERIPRFSRVYFFVKIKTSRVGVGYGKKILFVFVLQYTFTRWQENSRFKNHVAYMKYMAILF